MSLLSLAEIIKDKNLCSFYKLIGSTTLQQKKLRIPNTFAKRYEDELSLIAILTAPTGRVWLVDLEKSKHSLWFQNGWQQFMDFYSIQLGYFLMFTYEGKSNFTVRIFDLKVSELNYLRENGSQDSDKCIASDRTEEFGIIRGKEDNTRTDIDIANEGRLSIKAADTKDVGIQLDEIELMSSKNNVGVSDEAEHKTKRVKCENIDTLSEGELVDGKMYFIQYPKRRVLTAEQRLQTIQVASMFKSRNPWCTVVLRPSYIYKGVILHLPCSFSRKYFNGFIGFVTLQFEGRQWAVRCICKDGSANFCKGWPDFVYENCLEEGDVCVFELLSTETVILKVTVFRAFEVAASMNQVPYHQNYLT